MFLCKNIYAETRLINKVIFCTPWSEPDYNILWGIKFNINNKIEFYVYSNYVEEVDSISGSYESAYNNIFITIQAKPSGTKTYSLNRTTLIMKVDENIQWDKDECYVREYMGKDFLSYFKKEYRLVEIFKKSEKKI